MSVWPGKYIIGLTGNIATGKSLVRKMLEYLGAFGIDADAIAHRAIAKGAPGYKPVVKAFGSWVLNPVGDINRYKLGRLVFSDNQALEQLETIVHPLVKQAISILVHNASQKIIVIEAIKLLESNLSSSCDSIWVTYAPIEVQLSRLVQNRSMDEQVARQRIEAQSSQEEKMSVAQVVIDNRNSVEDTWRQVLSRWRGIIPPTDTDAPDPASLSKGQMLVTRARLNQAQEIIDFIKRLDKDRQEIKASNLLHAFGEKAFLLLKHEGKLVGMAGWHVENLVSRTTDIYLEPATDFEKALSALITEVDRASTELQCEVSLVFLPPKLARHDRVWHSLGYQPSTIEKLGVSAWKEAAKESEPPNTTLLFKRLRKNRVMRPV